MNIANESNKPVEEVTPKTEGALQKRAEVIVRKSLQNTWLPLRNKGIDHRFMPGLWMLTINILISCLDVEDIMKILTNRAKKLALVGENDDAEPISLTPSQVDKYVKDIVLAAQTIDESISKAITALEEEGLDDRLPEAMLDSAIFLLVNGWGPKHLKRAIIEQVGAFVSKNITPVLFMEPSRMVDLTHPEDKKAPDTLEEQLTKDENTEDVVAIPIEREMKTMRALIDYSLNDNDAQWIAVIEKTSHTGEDELHLIQGSVTDFNGRVAPIKAAIEALKAIQHEVEGSKLTLETTNAFSIRGMEGDKQEKEALRHDSEKELWDEFDALSQCRKITYKTSSRNLSERIQHIGDMAMRCGIANIV